MLTGRTRYRVAGWFRRRLVLQVQYRSMEMIGQSFEPHFLWRDARLEDLIVVLGEVI